MEVARVPGALTWYSICSPYSTLQHLRRTFKFLAQLKRGGGNILVVGQRHKHACTFLSSHFPGLARLRGSPASAASSLSAASAHYSLLVCLDCVAFAPLLRNLNLPVLGVCTPRELHEHPEIIRILDYMIPHNGTRSDVALQKLLEDEVLSTPPQIESPLSAPVATACPPPLQQGATTPPYFSNQSGAKPPLHLFRQAEPPRPYHHQVNPNPQFIQQGIPPPPFTFPQAKPALAGVREQGVAPPPFQSNYSRPSASSASTFVANGPPQRRGFLSPSAAFFRALCRRCVRLC